MVASRIRSFLQFFICILIGAVFSSVVAFAWTGPTQTAPNGNVSAPINVGTTDQTKNAGLGVNSLAVFGNAIISTVGGYLNFGTTAGSGEYGIRDNNGTMEYKNNAGSWTGLGSLPSCTTNGATLAWNSTSQSWACQEVPTTYTISSDTQNVNLYTLAGSPIDAGTYVITVNSGVTVGSASTASAAVTTGTWPAGATVKLVNNGNIYGKGGNGGNGGVYGSTPPAGLPGGPAISLSNDLTIDNTNCKIFGGGGGGAGGPGLVGNFGVTSGGGGGGGGQGVANSTGGTGGSGSFPGGPGGDGTATGPGAGSGNNAYGSMTLYYSGSGGVWATVGGGGDGGGTGGAAGGAIQLNGKAVTWLGGNDSAHVKGAVQ